MQATGQEKILAIYKAIKDRIRRINKDLLKVDKKKTVPKNHQQETQTNAPWMSKTMWLRKL